MMAAGGVKVKQGTQSKDDFREAEVVPNVTYPISSINAPSILGEEGLVDLISPSTSSPINTPSLDIHGGESSSTSQENHHGRKFSCMLLFIHFSPTFSLDIILIFTHSCHVNAESTTNIIEKPVSSEVSEKSMNSISNPPKQQLLEPVSSEVETEDNGAPMANVEKQGAFYFLVFSFHFLLTFTIQNLMKTHNTTNPKSKPKSLITFSSSS